MDKRTSKESLESKLQLSLLTRSTQSSSSKFSLRLLGIFIARVNDLYWNGFLSKWAIFVCHLIHNFFVTYTLKSCFKAVNKLLIPLSIVWKSYIRFLVRLCTHNINFDVRNFDLFLRKIINVWGCNISLNWQVKTTYSWRGMSGRMSLFETNLTGVPSLISPTPSLLFFRAPFFFAPLPTIWTPGTGYSVWWEAYAFSLA